MDQQSGDLPPPAWQPTLDDATQESKGQPSSNPYVVEKELRGYFNGIRIVGEIDLSEAGPVYSKAKEVVKKIVERGKPARLKGYPAATAIFLTAEGARGYDEGTFWPNIAILNKLTGAQQSEVGEAFHKALDQFGLETFAHLASTERWLTNVSPILMHGGIPATYADDVAKLVLANLSEGIWDAEDLIHRTRNASTQWSRLTKPVQRFFEHGDEFARDLIQRMINTAADISELGEDANSFVSELSKDAGLPPYLTKALLGHERIAPQRGLMPPQPTVYIDRYSCDGPYITLPPCPHTGEWLVQGAKTRRLTTSKNDSLDIQLRPSHGWTATLRWQDNSTDQQSERQFTGLEKVHAYVFDASGKLTKKQHQIPAEQALILTAPGVTVSNKDGSPIACPEELPARTGLWSGWALRSLDLAGVSEVLVQSPAGLTSTTDVEDVLRVAKPPAQPTITSPPVRGCKGFLGGMVFAEPPTIALPQDTNPAAWQVRWRPYAADETSSQTHQVQSSPTTKTQRLAELDRSEDGFCLAPMLPSSAAFSGTIEVSGPLGSDLREHITVIRGLKLEVPERVCKPREVVHVPIKAQAHLRLAVPAKAQAQLRLDGGADCSATRLAFEPTRITFGAGCTAVPLIADTTEFTVTIPRLSWATQRTDGSFPTLQFKQLKIGLDEITSGEVGSLLVRCGRPSNIHLKLLDNETCLQTLDPVSACGPERRWSFSLAELQTTIAASTSPRLYLVICVDDLSERVAIIEAQFEVSNLSVSHACYGETSECLVSAEWTENRQFTGRQLRLWSAHRPWESSICAEVKDASAGQCDAILELLPGPYLAEVVVADEWSSPLRPNPLQESVIQVSIGSDAQRQTHLSGLRPDKPLEALELAVSGDARFKRLDVSAAAFAPEEFVSALEAVSQFEETDTRKEITAMNTLVDLVDLVVASNSLLIPISSMLVELPPRVLYRIEMLLVAKARCDNELTDQYLEILWKTLPTVAAALDDPFQGSATEESANASIARWERFSGWKPDPAAQTVTGRIEPVTHPLGNFEPERLRELQQALPPSDSLPLQWGGWFEAALEMLMGTWPDKDPPQNGNSSPKREPIHRWRSSYHTVHQYTQRFSERQHLQHDLLKPQQGKPAWHNFPADILAAAFHLIDKTTSRTDMAQAAQALCDAAEFAPLLTTRNILIALGLQHVDNAY